MPYNAKKKLKVYKKDFGQLQTRLDASKYKSLGS